MKIFTSFLTLLGLVALAGSTAGATPPETMLPGQVFTSGITGDDTGYVVVEDSTGRFIVGGSMSGSEWALTRFLADGSLDATFGTAGISTTAAITAGTNVIEAMTIDTSDRIIATGRSATGDIVVRRYLPDGTLDTSFGTTGTARTDLGGTETGYAIALDSQGRVVVTGTVAGSFPDHDVFVVRYTSSGVLDTAFNPGGPTVGAVVTDIGLATGGSKTRENALSLAIDGTDRILVGGFVANQWMLLRYTTSGVLDTTFDTNGIVPRNVTNREDFITWVDVDSQGRILVTGYVGSTSGSTSGDEVFAVGRYLDAGTLDTSYGTSGIARLDIGSSVREFPIDAMIAPDDGVVILGSIMSHSVAHDAVLLGFNSSGVLDTSVAPDGLLYVRGAGASFLPGSLINSANGPILGGYTTAATSDMALFMVPSASITPTASATSASLTASDSVTVTSNVTGTAYIVSTDITVTTVVSITSSDTNKWNSVSIPAANTPVALPLAGLTAGTYSIYVADSGATLSAPASAVITITASETSTNPPAPPTPENPPALPTPVDPPTPATPVDPPAPAANPLATEVPARPVAMISGAPVEVQTSTPEPTSLMVSAGSVSASLQIPDAGAVRSQADSLSMQVVRDRSGVISGEGAQPGSVVEVTVHSLAGEARPVASVTVAADGSYSGVMTFDGTLDSRPLPIGTHVLRLTADTTAGEQLAIDVLLEITQPAPSPERIWATGDIPEAALGELFATAAGEPEPVTVQVAPNEGLKVTHSDNWSMALQLEAAAGDIAQSGLSGARIEIIQDTGALVGGEGFMPGTRADVWLFSDPVLLGSAIITADGAFTGFVPVDASTVGIGEHTLQLQAVSTDGYVRSLNVGVIVAGPEMSGTLPVTGSDSTAVTSALFWAILLVVLGGSAVLLSTGRQRRVLKSR